MTLNTKIARVIIVDGDGQELELDADGAVPVTLVDDDISVTVTPFTLTSTTSWTTLVDVSGSNFVEMRIFGFGNDSASVTNVRFRFGTNSAFFDQPVAPDGGAYNQNCIGAYFTGGAAEDLQVSTADSVDSVYGHVITRTL